MAGEHAFLPPSGAAAWVNCAAWPAMNQRYPQPDTPDTLEGTAAHWVFAEMLAGRTVAEGQVAANGVTLSEEMIEAAEVFVDTIDSDLESLWLTREVLHVEQRIEIGEIHSENWGTPDVFFFDDGGRAAHVYDIKFGHSFVDACENWQLADYAAGVARLLPDHLHHDHALPVHFTVVQPRNYDRAGPVRRWSTTLGGLGPMFGRLRAAAVAATVAEPGAFPGEHCKHCPGRHACNTLQRAAYAVIPIARYSAPVELPAEALGIELAMLKSAAVLLSARVSGLEQEAMARATLRGERIPGYMLADTYGRDAWTRPAGEVLAIAQALGVNVSKPGLITPKQAIKAGLNADVVKAFSGAGKTGVKLVVDDGARARKVFGKSN